MRRSVPRSRRNMRHKQEEFAGCDCAGLDRVGLDPAVDLGNIDAVRGKTGYWWT